MQRVRMRPVASSDGVRIYCSEDGRFSFFNSPYPGHHSCTAVDVYPERAFGEVAPSPFGGEVVKVRMVECPQGKGFEGLSHDYVVIFRSSENPDRFLKTLHIKPLVGAGEKVEPGEDLGVLLRSGFFDFWTDPHVHVEVRKPSDPIRAQGGLKVERLIEFDNVKAAEDLRGTVVESKPEYSLVALDEKFKGGIPVDLGRVGLLDAGIPHYKLFGIHLDSTSPPDGTVRLCGRKIGIVKSAHSNAYVAECCNPAFTVNGEQIGLSFYLYPSSVPLVKIVPRRPNGLILKKFEKVSVVIS